MASLQKVQIFGERCSGTNYLEALIKVNLPSVEITQDFGYKHFFPKTDVGPASDYLFVIVFRDPFDWLQSIHRTPWHAAAELKKAPFSEFIRKEWWCVWDEDANRSRKDPLFGTEMMFERDPRTGERFENIMKMRTAKIRELELFRNEVDNSIYLTYEDLSKNPEKYVGEFSRKLGLEPPGSFSPVKSYKGVKWYQGWKTRMTRRRLLPISSEDTQYIISQLDNKIEEGIGYNIQRLAAEHRT